MTHGCGPQRSFIWPLGLPNMGFLISWKYAQDVHIFHFCLLFLMCFYVMAKFLFLATVCLMTSLSAKWWHCLLDDITICLMMSLSAWWHHCLSDDVTICLMTSLFAYWRHYLLDDVTICLMISLTARWCHNLLDDVTSGPQQVPQMLTTPCALAPVEAWMVHLEGHSGQRPS